MPSVVSAGVARRDITPALDRLRDVARGWYGERVDTIGDVRIRDRLAATALVLREHADDGSGSAAVLISLDALAVDRETADAIRRGVGERTGIDPGAVIVNATHTHSAPMTLALGEAERDDDYVVGVLVPAAIDAAADAAASIQPVRIGVAARHSDVGVNRRNPDLDGAAALWQYDSGMFDPNLTVIRIEGTGGTVANFVHYGAHATSYGGGAPGSFTITRDWPGVLVDRMEELTGATTLFFSGATGDVAPRTNSGGAIGDSEAALWEAGSRAAMDAMAAWRSIKEFRVLPVRSSARPVELPYEPLPSIAEAERGLAESRAHRDSGGWWSNVEARWLSVIEAHARPITSGYEYEQVVAAIGPVAIVAMPGEIFSELSLRLREHSPFAFTLASGLSNDCVGYLPDRCSRTRGGYEIQVSIAAAIAHERVVADSVDDVLVQLGVAALRELYGAENPPWPYTRPHESYETQMTRLHRVDSVFKED